MLLDSLVRSYRIEACLLQERISSQVVRCVHTTRLALISVDVQDKQIFPMSTSSPSSHRLAPLVYTIVTFDRLAHLVQDQLGQPRIIMKFEAERIEDL